MAEEPAVYPLLLTRVAGALCVVVGGGAVAERKLAGLLDARALARVVSPAASPTVERWSHEGRLEWLRRPYQPGDLAGALLAFAATDQPAVNQAVADEARSRGVLLNRADAAHQGDFHTPAIVRRRRLVVSIATGGAGPAVAALLRRRVEAQLGPEVDELLELVAELRAGPARELDAERRGALLRALASEQVLEWLRAGERAQVEGLIETHLRASGPSSPD